MIKVKTETDLSFSNGFLISKDLNAVFFKEITTNNYKYIAYYNREGKIVKYYKWYY